MELISKSINPSPNARRSCQQATLEPLPHEPLKLPPITLLSGVPPKTLYIHPDLQRKLLKANIPEPSLQPEREWVLPTSLGAKWTLSQICAVFDSLPPRELRRINKDGGDTTVEPAEDGQVEREATSLREDRGGATGSEEEFILGVQPAAPYGERLPSPEPITTLAGIEIALEHLLRILCQGLEEEGKGLRGAVFRGYRVDGQAVGIGITTVRPTHHVDHLFSLFSTKLVTIEPALGIELFVLEASGIEELHPAQGRMWEGNGGLQDTRLSQLLDRIGNRLGPGAVQRFLPEEHWWPERSIKAAHSLGAKPETAWQLSRPRPVHLLVQPQAIEVTAPIPDYPPMLFRYKGTLHKIVKADGPERIEQEWWIEDGAHRDYYAVEDEEGQRYWLFRSGHYEAEKKAGWFLHGFFA